MHFCWDRDARPGDLFRDLGLAYGAYRYHAYCARSYLPRHGKRLMVIAGCKQFSSDRASCTCIPSPSIASKCCRLFDSRRPRCGFYAPNLCSVFKNSDLLLLLWPVFFVAIAPAPPSLKWRTCKEEPAVGDGSDSRERNRTITGVPREAPVPHRRQVFADSTGRHPECSGTRSMLTLVNEDEQHFPREAARIVDSGAS